MPPKADAKAKAKGKAKPKKEETEEAGDKVQAPDREAFDAALAKIQEAIDGFQKDQKKLQEQISSRSGGKDDFFNQKAEFRRQLDEFTAKIDALMERKNEINKSMGDKRQEAVDQKNELNKLKKSVGYTDESKIDERIAEIEWSLNTESLTLKAEKDLLKEISELKKRRPQVAKVKGMEAGLANRDFGAGLKEQIGTINEEMALYRDGKRQVQEKMSKLMEARKEQLGDLPDIIEKRDAIGKKIQEKIQERNALRDEFRAKEREFNQYLREQREKRQAAVMEERAARQAEWNKQKLIRAAEKLDEQPHIAEITLIEQTMAYCKGLVATKDTEAKEEKKEVVHNNKEGEEVLASKKDRDEEYFFVPTAKKKSKSKAKGGAQADSGKAKAIKHNAVTFKLFDDLKLDAPITTDDIPATLEKLEQQLEEYKQKVKDWEVNREEMKKKILEGAGVDEEAGEEKKDEE